MVSDRSNGINWSVIAALVGLILIGAGEPPEPGDHAQNRQTAAKIENASKPIVSTIIQVAKTTEKDGGCQEGKDKRDSDLCAQWKAADAAADAAQYALWTLLISSLGTGLLVWTLWETRQTSRRELRAYISVHPCGINASEDNLVRAPLEFVNNGQTPAYDLKWFSAVVVHEGSPDNFVPDYSGKFKILQRESDAAFGAKVNMFVYRFFEYELCKPHLESIFTKRSCIIHYGFIDYRDIFKKNRRTYFAFYHSGADLSDANSKRCIIGNSAT